MRRLIFVAPLFALTLCAQQKKILVAYDNPALVHELQSVTTQAAIVPVNPANVMEQVSAAAAYIGDITSTEVRAGKNLKWVGVMSAGVERVLFPRDGTSDLRDSKI